MLPLDKQIKEYFGGFWLGIQDTLPERIELIAIKMTAEFAAYVDALARSNPAGLHHVYEWGMVGQKAGRLFDMKSYRSGNSVVITYEFLESRVPNENGYVFVDKAMVMEAGQEVSFETDKAVPIGDGEFRTGTFTFVPGGPDVRGEFAKTFLSYFQGQKEVQQNNVTIRPSNITRIGGYADARRML